jgi:hypothetical protein
VERGHGRDAEASRELEDVLAVLAAPDPVLMLDRDDVDAVVERAGCADVVGRLFLADAVMDLGRVERRVVARMKDGDLASSSRGREVTREGGDPASSRRIRRDEGGSNDERAPLGESVRIAPGSRLAEGPGAMEMGERGGRLSEPARLAAGAD